VVDCGRLRYLGMGCGREEKKKKKKKKMLDSALKYCSVSENCATESRVYLVMPLTWLCVALSRHAVDLSGTM
jgi:hypothetical protein